MTHNIIEKRPWGQFTQFTLNELSTVKIIVVHAGHRLSRQRHQHRDEQWYVVSGRGLFLINDEKVAAELGTTVTILRGTWHRMSASSDVPLVVLEVSRGHFDEHDEERSDDDYGRK